MEHFSINEVMEQAIQTEKMGFQYYTKTAEKFENNEDLKNLFEKLAAKELEHEKIFINLREKIGHQMPDNWGEISMYMRAIVESEFFLGTGKALPSMDKIKTVGDAITYAIRFEKDTLLYYHSLEALGEETDVIDDIINEERDHIIWLSDLRKSVS